MTSERYYIIMTVLHVVNNSPDVYCLNWLSANYLYNLSTNGLNVLSTNICPCDVHRLHELSTNGLCNVSLNGLNVLSINIFPRVVCGLHELFVNFMNALSIQDCSCDLG